MIHNFKIISTLFLLIISILLNLNFTSSTFISKKNEICTKSSYSIDSHFSSNISSSFNNDFFSSINNTFKKIDNSILQIILLNQTEESQKYHTNIFLLFSTIKYIMIILMVLSFFLIVHFELHFIFLINGNNEKQENESTKNPNNDNIFVNLSKISPFLYYKFLNMKDKEINNYYKEIEAKKYSQTKKIYKIIFLFLIFSMIIISFIINTINQVNHKKAKKNVYGTTCTLMKFLYEMKYGNRDYSDFIGLENAIEYIKEIKQKSTELNNIFDNLNQKYNTDALQKIEKWNLLINEINNKLSNTTSKEYFFENYPSNVDDISEEKNWKKKLYQAEIIYNYYPMNDENKVLYKIKNNFNSKISNVLSNINEFNNVFSSIKIAINNMLNNNSMEIYQKIIKKLDTIIFLYLNTIENKYIPNIHTPFLEKNITILASINNGFVLLIGVFLLLSVILIEHQYFHEWFFWKKTIMCVLYNIILILLLLSFIEIYLLLDIDEKRITVENIYKGLNYLFNKNNNIKSLSIKDTNLDINNDKNLFNYLNDIIENDGKINKILNIGELDTNNLNIISKKLKIIYNNNNLSSINDDLNNFIINIQNVVKKGLVYNTNFNIIDGNVFQGFDSPITYLSYINKMTSYDLRINKFGNKYPDFNCNEYWNISTMKFEHYVYKNKKDVIDCDGCVNRYTNSSPPLLLNFEEYTIDQILKRYENIKNYQNIYYYLEYYFNATENLRDPMKQITSLYNFTNDLGTLENEIFESLKKCLELIKEIISLYETIFVEGINKSLNMNFLKSDLYFLLNQMNITYLNNMKNIYINQFIISSLNIIICSTLIITYCIFSYKIPYYADRQNNEVSCVKKINVEQSNFFQQIGKKSVHKKKMNSFEEKLKNDIFVSIKNDDKKTDNNQINNEINGGFINSSIITNNIYNNIPNNKGNEKKNNEIIFNEKVDEDTSNIPIANTVIRNINKDRVMSRLNRLDK